LVNVFTGLVAATFVMFSLNSAVAIYCTVYHLGTTPPALIASIFIQLTVSQNYGQGQFVKYGFSGGNAILGNKYPIELCIR
jgi:hypothetical protein